jgi:DNA-binding MarR family transcriptional regulator
MTDEPARPARVRRLPSWLLTQAASRAHRLVSAALKDADSHQHQYLLLAALAEFGPSSQASLSRHSGMDRSDVVAVVNALAEKQLVTRSVDPTHRRRNVVAISERGTDMLRELDEHLAAVQSRLLEGLSGSERSDLIRMLTCLLGQKGHDGP